MSMAKTAMWEKRLETKKLAATRAKDVAVPVKYTVLKGPAVPVKFTVSQVLAVLEELAGILKEARDSQEPRPVGV